MVETEYQALLQKQLNLITKGGVRSFLHRVTEHCLVGIRGGVKRSSDSRVVLSRKDGEI